MKAIGRVFGPDLARRLGEMFAGVDGVTERARRLLDLPSPIWRPVLPWGRLLPEEGKAIVERLRYDGVAVLPSFWNIEQITSIRRALEGHLVPTVSPLFEFSPTNHYYQTRQPLAICPEFALGAIDCDVLSVIGRYFRRMPFLSQSDFRRVLPLDAGDHERNDPKFAKGYSSSHWHHDVHGREVKMLVYVSDVGTGDQNFAYARGSHKGFRSLKYDKSRFSDERVTEMGYDIVECFGPAGTAVIFDSNGIHRLRRRQTHIRDCITYYYRPGRMGYGAAQHIHPAALAADRPRFERFTIVA